MRILFVLFYVFLLLNVYGQEDHFIIYLTDKGSSYELMNQPELFLSKRAILRKEVYGIPLDESDLPVCKVYQRKVSDVLKGRGRLLQKSKWLNALFVEAPFEIVDEIQQLPFVQQIVHYRPSRSQLTRTQVVNHGLSRPQIEMLHGEYLHNQGFLGQGMLIAVFDGGYFNANTATVFDSLWQQGRVKLTFNFNNNTTNIFFPGSHGTSVLGVLASLVPGQMVGTAPKADYILLQTEYEPTETRQEEYNWLAGAELSDSMGVDIINSSLGYNTFDDPSDNYTLSQLDGQTAIVTQAALFAARKGILVVNSAGNEGNKSWGKILFPADADSILAVGGVNSAGQRVNFSSMGPTADGRIKPDIAAQAFQVITINSSGNATTANGTSFSAPLISGLAACLWQAFPNKNFFEIRNAILQSGNQASNPDTLLGYGIPNFQLAASLLLSSQEFVEDDIAVSVYPVPANDAIFLSTNKQVREITVFDGYGRNILYSEHYNSVNGIDIRHLPAGLYFIQFKSGETTFTRKFIKH
ncbi:S8/S53 family peptidase [Schleiferia thermophila]|jgi:subtilisin family serine protease|uniref:Putative secreted protein (Por secretion system target) n=1 Tax=Schleiferia thermophila TaxID=884107 RepID=A0A369A7A8_9FLAO|nr:S8/S53 family peptidase [Schleiferia thermophila]KFD39184.1 peptidase S8 [Schleiferia thermophila str. Yellowstone]RCX03314.1 putative secreted protein (Por secretion system target) [Schleiferia thermophila]GCD80443.1 serine protease [Schleiferia thermophila]